MNIDHPSFGTLNANRIIIFDTTLRDGEQSPGFSMNLNEKIRMAECLTDLGVDVLEAGFAIASQGDFESVRSISETIGQRANSPVIASLARAGDADVLRAAEALRPAKRRRIHIVIATSDLHMKHKLRLTPEEVIEATIASVTLARRYAEDVEWSAEDATRSDPDFLCRVAEAAIRAGATTINLPDTVGYALPEDMARMFADVRARVPGAERIVLSAHNHNDLGLAVANTIASIRAGARQVECTINGIGERAGNASLEEIVMAIRTRHDAIPVDNNIVTQGLLGASKLLATITSFDVQPNKAIVGRNAFAHEAGIHQDGVLKLAATYEIMTPESVGWAKNSLVLGKHSGRAAFRDRLEQLGYTQIGANKLNDAFRRFKDLADAKKVVFDEDIVALVDDEVLRDHDRVRFEALEVTSSSMDKVRARATVQLHIDGELHEATATGDGPIDATFKAIKQLVEHEATLVLFKVEALTPDTDAQAKTTVRLDEHGKLVDGQGSDTDTVVSAARAYVHALNKLIVKRQRTAPAALSH